MTIVLEMYELDQIERIRMGKEMGCYEDGLGLIDLDELYEKVLRNVNSYKIDRINRKEMLEGNDKP